MTSRTRIKRRLGLLFCFWVIIFPVFAKQDVLLLKTFDDKRDVSGWLMSEKLDGVRAYWDGSKLISRGGNQIYAPAWFVKDFPNFALDGELWTKRQDFEEVVSIVRRQKPDERWKRVSYQVFDVPNSSGGLKRRLQKLGCYLSHHSIPHLKIIEQVEVRDNQHLKTFLSDKLVLGAEGIVVRHPQKSYRSGRSGFDLKVKPFFEQECRVVGYQMGKGKYQGMTGTLLCEMKDKVVIKVGSGLTDRLRQNPPSEGVVITFKYYGLTKKGKPRHPVFLRVRIDSNL